MAPIKFTALAAGASASCTVAISTDPDVQGRAVDRLSNLDDDAIKELACDPVEGRLGDTVSEGNDSLLERLRESAAGATASYINMDDEAKLRRRGLNVFTAM